MYRPMKYGYSRFPVNLGIMLSQPLNWEVSTDTLLELTNFPADFLLMVTDTHGEWRGISLACPFNGRSIGAGHSHRLAPFDPRQFMLKHKLRVHNSTGAARIHEKGPLTLAILAMFSHPMEDGLDKQSLAVLWQRRCFLVFGWRRFGRLTLCFSLGRAHSWFQYVRGLPTPRSSTTSRWNTTMGIFWYKLVYAGMQWYCVASYFFSLFLPTHTRLRVSGQYPSSVCLIEHSIHI
jgi:hypothetical protein